MWKKGNSFLSTSYAFANILLSKRFVGRHSKKTTDRNAFKMQSNKKVAHFNVFDLPADTSMLGRLKRTKKPTMTYVEFKSKIHVRPENISLPPSSPLNIDIETSPCNLLFCNETLCSEDIKIVVRPRFAKFVDTQHPFNFTFGSKTSFGHFKFGPYNPAAHSAIGQAAATPKQATPLKKIAKHVVVRSTPPTKKQAQRAEHTVVRSKKRSESKQTTKNSSYADKIAAAATAAAATMMTDPSVFELATELPCAVVDFTSNSPLFAAVEEAPFELLNELGLFWQLD